MPISIPRLRTWFAVLAIAVLALVAGFYFYARFQVRNAIKQLPKKMGIDIQQTAEGFSFSKSEGGRTLFTIRASKATQYKQGGRAELRDVNIVVYGRQANRFDQIYGKSFDYDANAGTVVANGEVHIDLEGNDEGQQAPDQAPPREMKNPIHLRVIGLSFNQKTGIAQTDGLVEFRVPQAQGTAQGAVYDSKKQELTLLSNIDVKTNGDNATSVQAKRGVITNEPRAVMLDSVHVVGEDRELRADNAKVDLTPDSKIQHFTASGNVEVTDRSEGGFHVRAPKADASLNDDQELQSALLSGGVDFDSSAKGASSGHAGEMQLMFKTVGGKNKKQQLDRILARNGVVVRNARDRKSSSNQAIALESNAMTLGLANGNVLRSAQTDAPGKITVSQSAGARAGEQTIVTADRFHADFGADNHLAGMRGGANVRLVSHVPSQPDRVSTSNSVVATFTPEGDLSGIVQEGNFHYAEGMRSDREPGGRSATADRATYRAQDDTLQLTGSPRVVDGGMTVTADSIRLQRTTGEAFAQGSVKTTYSDLKVQPNGAMLASSDPVHVSASTMTARQQPAAAHYSGGARLWQGANSVEAPTIDFDQVARTIVAQGDRNHLVTSVFVQVDAKGKTTPVMVTARRLTYADSERQAHYTGGVTARGQDITLTAEKIDVLLSAASTTKQSATAPSQLDRIIASSHVAVRQTDRNAEGEKLVYNAADGSFVLSGGQPTLTDPANGTVRGDSLTFYSRDDKVIVEANGASRTVTRTRISR